jgi:hypothetical protein
MSLLSIPWGAVQLYQSHEVKKARKQGLDKYQAFSFIFG